MWSFIYCFFLASAVVVFSEKIQVDQDSNAVLFNNVTADNRENEVYLYINGDNRPPDRIVKWTFENEDIKTTWSMYNYTKLYMDANRNIRIANIDKNYEGKYYLQSSKIRDVDLAILRINNSTTVMPTTLKEVTEGINNSTTVMPTTLKEVTEGINNSTTVMPTTLKEVTEGACNNNSVTIAILVIVTVLLIVVLAVVFIFHKYALSQCKKIACCQCEKVTENKQGKENIPLLDISQQQKKQFVSDVKKPSLSLKWRFSGRTQDNKRKPWLLDLILNPDDDLIVTDGENNELKKFSLEGKLKSKRAFQTRPDCIALTDGYLAMVTFPRETVLRVIDTGDLSDVSTIDFKPQCAGIGSMNDGRLIICNRESRSVILSSKNGEILQEIKTGSSGETLFRKPSYVRVVDSKTIYVSDYRTKEFFMINVNDDNTFTINKHQINYPRTSCVVDGMLLVAASNIRLYTLDGNEAGEVTLDGVRHVRGLAFSEGKRLLAITHQSDADEEISVYEVMKN